MFDGEPLTLDYVQPVLRRVFPEDIAALEPNTKTDTFLYTLNGMESEVSVVISLKTKEVQIITPGSAFFKEALKLDPENMYSNAYFQAIGNCNLVETVLLCMDGKEFERTDLIQIDGFITGDMSEILRTDAKYKFYAWKLLVNGKGKRYSHIPKLIRQFFIPYAGTVYYDSLESDLNMIFYNENDICYLEVKQDESNPSD